MATPFPAIDLIDVPQASRSTLSPEFIERLRQANEAARAARAAAAAAPPEIPTAVAGPPPVEPAVAPAPAAQPASRLARTAAAARGFGSGLLRKGGGVAGGLYAGQGALDMLENGLNLDNALKVSTGGLAAGSLAAPALAVPALAAGGGTLLGAAATPAPIAESMARTASGITDSLVEDTRNVPVLGTVVQETLGRLFPRRFAFDQGTGPVTTGQTPPPLSKPIVESGSIPSAVAQPSGIMDVEIPVTMPVLSRNQQGGRGTGVIRNNETGTVTEIRPQSQRVAFGAAADNVRKSKESDLVKYGPLVAAFLGPQAVKALDRKIARSEERADVSNAFKTTQAQAAARSAAAAGVQVVTSPDPTNPLKTNIIAVDKATGKATRIEAPTPQRVVTKAELDEAAKQFVPAGAAVTAVARRRALTELAARGFDVSQVQ